VNFTATATATFTISGTLSPTAGGSGATVTLSGASNATTTANGSGNYSFSGLSNGGYTVTPSNTGYTFSPGSQPVTIDGANVTGVNFTATATATFTISGTLSPTAGGSGATVTLSGASNATTTANGSGNYSFSGLSNGGYTVTPSNTGYTFSPGSQPVTIDGANVTDVNFTASTTQQASGAPVLFFSDLLSGPATGNSDTTYSSAGGVYVTLYGNFLTGYTSVDLNAEPCLTVVSGPSTWLWYQRMVVELGTSCTSGNFTVTTPSGTSNGIPFTVTTTGHIYFASGSGNDSGAGTFASPWKTLLNARNTMVAGDTTYAETGSDQTTDDGSGWSTTMLITTSGSAGLPISMVGYPGETVTIGSTTIDSAIRSGQTIPTNYWNIAELTLRGYTANSIWGSNYWRWVGNDISCPQGNGEAGCYEPIESTYQYTYGNNIHNSGVTGASAEFHGVYIGTDCNFQDFGWNEVGFVNGGRAIQLHSAPNGPGTLGYDLYSISIHDNVIHDSALDGMVLDTLSPSDGPVAIYNNVLYNVGTTTPPEGTGDWSGIYATGYTEAGPSSSGVVEIFNNTLYAYGLNASPPYGDAEACIAYGGYSVNEQMHIRNNVCYSTDTSIFPTGVPYFVIWNANTGNLCGNSDNCPWIYGTNNLLFGAGTNEMNLSNITGSLASNPDLTSVTTYNFLPLVGSPVLGAGTPIGVTPFGVNNIARDINGVLRPSTPSIGAYE
jgi:hypothetical protein